MQAVGWIGMVFCHVSPFERRILANFAKNNPDDVKLMRPDYFDSEEFRLCEHGMWFKTFDLRAELVALVEQAPTRSRFFQLDEGVDAKAVSMKHRALFNSVNWCAFESSDGEIYLSIEDSSNAAMVRMLLV